MAKLDTSRSALLTEDFLALIQSDEDRQVAASDLALDRIYAIRKARKHDRVKRITTATMSVAAMRQAGWQ